jgi:hypothetical protein
MRCRIHAVLQQLSSKVLLGAIAAIFVATLLSSGQRAIGQILGTGAIQRTVLDKCFVPRAYGADPTGSANSDAALSSIIEAIGTSSGCIEFGPGNFKFSRAISFSLPAESGNSITIRGAGSKVTTLYWPASQSSSSGIQIAIGGTGNNTVHMSGMSLLAGQAGTSGNNAINITGASATPVTNQANDFNDITCEGYDHSGLSGQSDYWPACIATTLVSNIQYYNILVYGSASNAGTGIVFQGDGIGEHFAIAANLSNSNFFNLQYDFVYGTFAQGVTITQTNFQNSGTGVYLAFGGLNAYELVVSDSQFGNCSSGIDIDADIINVNINNNLFLIPTIASAIAVNAGRGLIISGNQFTPAVMNPNVSIGIDVTQDDGASAPTGIITGNVFGEGTISTISNGIILGALSHDWRVLNNIFSGVVLQVSDAGSGNVINNP